MYETHIVSEDKIQIVYHFFVNAFHRVDFTSFHLNKYHFGVLMLIKLMMLILLNY